MTLEGQSDSIARLSIHPPPMTGRAFLLQLFRMLVRLSAAEIVVSLAIWATGANILRILLCVYVLFLLLRWFSERVQNAELVLDGQSLYLFRESAFGGMRRIRIPLKDIAAVRTHCAGEDLKITYRSAQVADRTLEPAFRIRLVWVLTLISARLARALAGRDFFKTDGQLIAFYRNGEKSALLIPFEDRFDAALLKTLPDRFDRDDRTLQDPILSMGGRARRRAFPTLYPHVLPLFPEEDEDVGQTGRKKKPRHGRKKRKKGRKAELDRKQTSGR